MRTMTAQTDLKQTGSVAASELAMYSAAIAMEVSFGKTMMVSRLSEYGKTHVIT